MATIAPVSRRSRVLPPPGPDARGAARRRVLLAPVLALLSCVLGTGSAAAHVIVTPARSAPSAAELYTVTVPSERPVPTVRLRLEIPPGVVVYAFGATAGWDRTLQEDSAGNVTAIIWSGGSILPEEFQQFSFMARNPNHGDRLTWRAYQSYSDGMVVPWTGGPASPQPAAVTSLGLAAAVDANAAGSGDGSSVLAGIDLAVALLALGLSLCSLWVVIVALRSRVL